MNRRRFLCAVLAVLTVGTLLRVMWLRADPPAVGAVGIIWHDEGPWTHSARNRVLWGQWRTDEWNPVFVAPVFTALEYGAFRVAGVGLWQARLVPVVSGLAALICLMIGLHAVSGRRAAAIGGVLLAVNYAFVMWNRAALMESTMTAFIVAGWAAYALSERRALWGLAAGACAVLAFFSKASAAFFVAALCAEALISLLRRWRAERSHGRGPSISSSSFGSLEWLTLAGVGLTLAAIGVWFVLPHWNEYFFYNWQMSVTRKPTYSLKDLQDRASWFPFAQGLLSRMPGVLAAGTLGLLAIALRWPRARPAERLLVWWVLVGLLELVVHDSSNERRYVMFIPAFVALAALLLARERRAGPAAPARPRIPRLAWAPLLLPLSYLMVGSLLRPVFLHEVDAGRFHTVVQLSALLAVVASSAALWQWNRLGPKLESLRVPPAIVLLALSVDVSWNGFEDGSWALRRSDKNYAASVALGKLLPPETLVQGKLANGLALDNRIRPLFIGNGFGNFANRLRQDDARYILTYDLPSIGFESSKDSGLIEGILERYPNRRVVATLDVDETPDVDRAILIDKFPDGPPAHARD